MTGTADLEIRAARQKAEVTAAERRVPTGRLPVRGLYVLAVLVAILFAVVVARWAWSEERMAAQSQMIGELATQVEDLGGTPVHVPEDGAAGLAGVPGTNGQDGRDGVDGQDGQSGTPGPQGDPGTNGTDGAPGPAGVGIASVTCDEQTGQWVITHTDGTTYNPGGYCIPQPAPQPEPEPEQEPINA